MSISIKKIDVRLSTVELEIIKTALEFGDGGHAYRNLKAKIEEIIEMNEEPKELTREEWHEKYGCEHDD